MRESFKIYYPKSKAEMKRWTKENGTNKYYAGSHWSVRKRDAEYWHLLTRSAMNNQEVRKRPFEKPVIIRMYFNDRLDCSNHGIIFKMIEDGMKGRLINDDNRRWVKGCAMYFHDEDYILVCVDEID
jgi:hypothetical protein